MAAAVQAILYWVSCCMADAGSAFTAGGWRSLRKGRINRNKGKQYLLLGLKDLPLTFLLLTKS